MGPTLFVNIGWMRRYQGIQDDDPLFADNFRYARERKDGEDPPCHEPWNFLARDGEVIGYVPNSLGIGIDRLGAARKDKYVNGVLVVFIAMDPYAKLLKVVGWYRNATVARKPEFVRTCDGVEVDSAIKASAEDAHVLPVVERGFVSIPTAHSEPGGVGQSPLWYAPKHPHVIEAVWKRVNSYKNTGASSHRPPRNHDPKKRKRVEMVAMDMAMEYFDDTVDVSSKCRGWDIEATRHDGPIYVEVKGISGDLVNFELTPNEFTKMGKHTDRYYLFVVTRADSADPVARTYVYVSTGANAGKWVCEDGSILDPKPRTGAWVTTSL